MYVLEMMSSSSEMLKIGNFGISVEQQGHRARLSKNDVMHTAGNFEKYDPSNNFSLSCIQHHNLDLSY